MDSIVCTVRTMTIGDYSEVAALWRRSEGISLSESDTKQGVDAFLERNPGLSAVAHAIDGEILGAVLCGHDGRRGYLHHLAVATAHRRRGIAQRMVQHCFAGLARARILKCNVFVLRDSPESISFWTHNGWKAPTWQVMQKPIDASPL